MVRKTQADSWLKRIHNRRLRRLFPALLSIALIPAGASFLRADSLASKNAKGNRFFAQGKYKEAENAYLDAEVKHPGRPEILYNLGNSLIKQKEYAKGIQNLQQSIEKGERATGENSWYNAGNAYFLMGDYRNSSDAFIRALKLNPADKDAKHNLELALMKLKQQQQEKTGQNSRNSENQKQDPRSMDKKNQNNAGNRNQEQGGSGDRKEKGKNQPSAEQQTARDSRSSGSMTREQALQILDALKNQELQDQRMLMQNRTAQHPTARDW